MFPNLLEATKTYWRQLDTLEASYQQGEVSLDDVNDRVAELMAELAQERRAALANFWQDCQQWLTEQREVIFGLASLTIVLYAWMLTKTIA